MVVLIGIIFINILKYSYFLRYSGKGYNGNEYIINNKNRDVRYVEILS